MINKYHTITGSSKYYKKYLSIIIISTTILITILGRRLTGSLSDIKSMKNGSLDNSDRPEVLLIYVFSNTHAHAMDNLKYFIEHAVRENDGVDYYFILQNVNNKTVNESQLPPLPKGNAHYIQHENLCFDLGTFGWFLSTHTTGNPWANETTTSTTADQKKKLNIKNYKYFFFMNSSIRGPYFPPYFLKFLSDYKTDFGKTFHWYYIFTKRINEKVKLVGITISCFPIPHIQSYLFVTDYAGLSILLKPNEKDENKAVGIFACFADKIHAAFNIEVPSSTRILDAGYMIDCVLTKYQGTDFSKIQNHLCSQHRNPYTDWNYDGTALEPYEAVFMKYNETPDTQIPKRRVLLYEKWIEDATNRNRSSW